ncbi:MAG: magnesium transporter [Intrasporangium sp.]|uniref:magnesium transporter n=1 Tax=Intrasporangium sp. TaxID=1925024 RepID=UPI002648EB66|nr:magnesium transporter [Intrasporangium sp.]MDN5794913.1 magnesium transporter [Intrasporangium sp.]
MTGTTKWDLDETTRRIRTSLQDTSLTEAAETIAAVPTPELITTLERLDPKSRAVAYRLLPKDRAVAVFERLDPAMQGDLVAGLRDEDVAQVFAALGPDDRVQLLDELPAEVANRLLQGLAPDERELTSVVLGYRPGSIGRRMSPQFVSAHPDLTVAETLEHVRAGLDQAETIYTIPVLNDHQRLVGVVSLRDLLRVDDRTSRIGDLMSPAYSAVASTRDEVAARRCADLKLLALLIVDEDDRLVGILTVDDALRILEEAESEDQARIGGSEPLRSPYLSIPIGRIVRSRVVWLLVLAIGAILTVKVLETFEATLAEMVVLSVFIPLLIGTGGNAGNQAATTVTRALALGDLDSRDVFPVLSREARTGFCLGLLLGTIGFLLTTLFYGPAVGAVVGLTLLSVCTLAASVGGVMPLLANAVRADPAVFSNPFITTFVDATGLVVYFLIAKALLGI